MLLSTILYVAAAIFTIEAKNTRKRSVSKSVSKAAAFQAPSNIAVTDNVLTLTKQKSAKGYNPRSAAWLMGLYDIVTGNSTILTSL